MTDNVVPVTLAEILTSLSVALDLVEGQPQGHAVRTCLLAMRIGEQLGLSEHDRTRLYFASILKDAGCSNNAARVHKVFGGDEHLVKHDVKLVDWSDPVVSLKFALGHTEVGGSIGRKLRRMLGNLAPPAKIMDEVTMARCSRGAEIARSLGFDEDVASAVRDLDEHWDGGGSPRHKRGEEIPMLARLVGLAQTLEVFAAALGRDAALDMVRDRSGRWFDPETCEAVLSLKDDPIWKRHAAFLEEGTSLLPVPEAAQQASPADIDRVCQAFAQIVDAKSAHTGEHSSRVTDYAVTLGADFGLDRVRLLELKRAALLHDIGKLGVPNGILDKPGRLTDDEFGRIKLHPMYSFRILHRIRGFERLAEIASAHHERLDGRGYWRGLDARRLDLEMRILAAADVFDALCASRPYRDAMPVEKALAIMRQDAGAHLDPDCVAMLEERYLRVGLPLAA